MASVWNPKCNWPSLGDQVSADLRKYEAEKNENRKKNVWNYSKYEINSKISKFQGKTYFRPVVGAWSCFATNNQLISAKNSPFLKIKSKY